MDSVEVLSFLFMLGSLELGQDYSKANLSAAQLRMLEDLSDYGLIYQSSPSSRRFYPTRLATTLTSDSSALLAPASYAPTSQPSTSAALATPAFSSSSSAPTQGFIVLETNYRLYAYTSSPLQIAILQLFARLSTRYPNMVAGKITRESTARAVRMGITADQIVAYLASHAHSQMRRPGGGGGGGAGQTGTVLPPTVVDQIRLWQIEGERMKSTPGFLFKEFAGAPEYEACCAYAREIGVLAWSSDERRMFFVTRVEQVAAFLKARQKK